MWEHCGSAEPMSDLPSKAGGREVQQNQGLQALGGCGRSRRRTPLRGKFPANREFNREFYRIRADLIGPGVQKGPFYGPFRTNGPIPEQGSSVTRTGNLQGGTGTSRDWIRISVSVHFSHACLPRADCDLTLTARNAEEDSSVEMASRLSGGT